MSSNDTTDITDTTETLTSEELNLILNEEVEIVIPTTLFGFVSVQSALEMLFSFEADRGEERKANELLDLRDNITLANPDIQAKFELAMEYVRNDSIVSVDHDVPMTVLPKGADEEQ